MTKKENTSRAGQGYWRKMALKQKIEYFMQWFSWSIVIASFVTMFITFAVAYTSPDKSVIIHINHYGEANLELFLLSLGAVSIIYMVCKGMKDDKKRIKNVQM